MREDLPARRGLEASYLIFPAGPADAAALAQLHVATWRETYPGLLPAAYLARMSETAHARRFAHDLARLGPREVILAAAERAGLVGYATGGPSRRKVEGEAEIHTLYVLRRAQGLGLGAALLRSAARAMGAQGARSLVISVLEDNRHARRFYEHLGGLADPPRLERGPGGAMLQEVAYRWPDIGSLTG